MTGTDVCKELSDEWKQGGLLKDGALLAKWTQAFVAWLQNLVAEVVVFIKILLLVSENVWEPHAMCQSQATMEGKTVIVTGATSGVGRETAKELARRKARVIIGCRNLNKAKDLAQEIFDETKQLVVVKHLDLHSLKSVRDFCDDIIRTERRLDVLINNAGSVGRSKEVKLTEDGYEEIFQVNHLAPFLLMVLLVDLMKKSSPSRVVNVTSNYHRLGGVSRMEDRARGVNPVSNPTAVYGNAKLALCLSTLALAERLRDAGVTANFLHPGSVDTPIVDGGSRLRKFFFYVSLLINGKTPLQGAQTSIRLAVDPDLEGTTGEYFDNCVPAAPQHRSPCLSDTRLAEEVFRSSLKLVKCDWKDTPAKQ